MAWFAKKPRTRALTAAGQRIVPQTAVMVGSRRNDWQRLAWAYRTSVPELRFVGGFVATQLSRVRWYIAEVGPEGHQPRPVTGKPPEKDEKDGSPSEVSLRTQRIAMDALERLDLNSRGSSMAGRAAENFEYAGECYLLGEVNAVGVEEWSIRSVSEVKVSREGNVELVEPGKAQGRPLDLSRVELFRLWTPDPEYLDWADAKITACLGVLEEIVVYDRQARAAARSRIASGSLLYVPEELSLTRPGSAPVDVQAGVEDDDDLFMAELTAGMLTPISSDEDPSAIVPLVVRGPAMGPEGRAMKDLIGTVQIPREEVTDLIAKRDAAVQKLAHGMDFPPEIITGIGDVNHWNSWIVSDATVRQHLEPRCENLADSITASYLRETCLAQGCPPEEVARLCIWYDTTELSQPADPMGIAKDLWDRNAISNAALRRAGGYEDDDAPSAKESLIRTLSEGRTYEASIPIIFAMSDIDLNDPKMREAIALAHWMADKQKPGQASIAPPGQDGQVVIDRPSEAQASPQKPVPDDARASHSRTAPPGVAVAASAARDGQGRFATVEGKSRYKVDETLCRQLAAVDSRAIAELGGFIDAAILDIVRQAANRIRSGALRASAGTGEREMFRKDSDPVAIIAAAGPGQQWTVTDQQALEGALDRIQPRWMAAVRSAANRISGLLRKLLGNPPRRDLLDEFERRAAQAWPRLAGHIQQTAIGVLHGATPRPDPDADEPVMPRSVLAGALTEVGGLPETSPGIGTDGSPIGNQPATGLAAGTLVQDEITDAGGVELGRVWQWDGPPREPFQPHYDLDGVHFVDLDDPQLEVRPGDEWVGSHYRPGDHAHCACRVSLLAAVPREPGVHPDDATEEIAQLRAKHITQRGATKV